AGKPCAPRLSGGFLFVVLGVGLPDAYQGDFLREKPAGFSLFFAFLARFRACKGRYAVIVGGKSLFLLVSGIFFLVLAENFPPNLNLKGGIPMRNLKRALSLGLTAAMISGLMVMGSSAASYADVTSENNVEAIEVLESVGIMIGDESGNFNPDQNVTRNEMAVVMANLMEYNVASYKDTSPFTDVPSWAEPYVAACWTNGITAGYSDTIYGGSDTVTTAQARSE